MIELLAVPDDPTLISRTFVLRYSRAVTDGPIRVTEPPRVIHDGSDHPHDLRPHIRDERDHHDA